MKLISYKERTNEERFRTSREMWLLVSIAVTSVLLGGEFAKLGKATVNFVMSLLPSVRMEQLGWHRTDFNPYPTAFPYGNGMVIHFYQQQESSTTKTVHKVINKGLKAYV